MAKFEKGHPGGPGRPKKTPEQIKFERDCREWASLLALDKLKKAAGSNKPMEAIAAVKEILDRGFGKSEAISYIEANVTSEAGSSVEEIARDLESIVGDTAGSPVCGDSEAKVDAGK